jgi:hypothetical protein
MKLDRLSIDIHLGHWDIWPFGFRQKGINKLITYVGGWLCFWVKIEVTKNEWHKRYKTKKIR